jgi:co-chaperonin GroES (HSP10)
MSAAGSIQRVYINSEDFQPRADFLLVKTQEFLEEETTASGIVLHQAKDLSGMERPTAGIAVCVGNEVDAITEGDFVMWPNTDGLNIEFDDGQFLLLREKSIIGTKK